MTKYTIRRRDEETECSYCGYPLYIGDVAYMLPDERNVYCTTACAGTELAQVVAGCPVCGGASGTSCSSLTAARAAEAQIENCAVPAWPKFGCDWR